MILTSDQSCWLAEACKILLLLQNIPQLNADAELVNFCTALRCSRQPSSAALLHQIFLAGGTKILCANPRQPLIFAPDFSGNSKAGQM